jgi:hypothetical protein
VQYGYVQSSVAPAATALETLNLRSISHKIAPNRG